MTTQMGLTDKEAEERIFGNDLVNAKFIKENTCLSQHTLFKIEDWAKNNFTWDYMWSVNYYKYSNGSNWSQQKLET